MNLFPFLHYKTKTSKQSQTKKVKAVALKIFLVEKLLALLLYGVMTSLIKLHF